MCGILQYECAESVLTHSSYIDTLGDEDFCHIIDMRIYMWIHMLILYRHAELIGRTSTYVCDVFSDNL